jgi:hypothetical protein
VLPCGSVVAEMRCLRPEKVHRSEKVRAKCRRHRILAKKNMCRGVSNLSQPGTRRQSLLSNGCNHCKKLVITVFSSFPNSVYQDGQI